MASRPRERCGDHGAISESGFSWVACQDAEASIVSYIRRAADPADFLVVACKITPVVRHGYRIGVPQAGAYREILNTDSASYGGSNVGNGGLVPVEPQASHGLPASLKLTLPPRRPHLAA